MFSAVDSPSGHFTLMPIPSEFFELPSPFGAGSAMLILQKFANNSAQLVSEHMRGISIAASQANGQVSACEVYGVTDRAGSEDLNRALSLQRAVSTLEALKPALSIQPFHTVFAGGLGERFAEEYHQRADNERNENFRGVVCYLWESFSAATDTILKIEVAFAAPPLGGTGRRRIFLPPLHMGRLRTVPRPPFA